MEKYTCPRCGGLIPNDLTPGAYPGALSRHERAVEICSECGSDEAVRDHFGRGALARDAWFDRAGGYQ